MHSCWSGADKLAIRATNFHLAHRQHCCQPARFESERGQDHCRHCKGHRRHSVSARAFSTFSHFVLTRDSLLEVPKLTIAAMRFTATARARILKAGGECLTIDELAQVCLGEICIRIETDFDSAPPLAPTPLSSVDQRTPVKPSSISDSDLTRTRSRTWPARAASSSAPVVAGGREVSRSSCWATVQRRRGVQRSRLDLSVCRWSGTAWHVVCKDFSRLQVQKAVAAYHSHGIKRTKYSRSCRCLVFSLNLPYSPFAVK